MAESSTVQHRDASAEIPVRRVDLALDPAQAPRDYYGHDEHRTLVLNALSTFFPAGERFFVDAVRHFRDRIDDPKLGAEIAAFMGQEAMHSKQHELFNALLDQQGLASTRFGDRVARVLLNRARRVLSKERQLSVTCALEHFTAILAEQMLRDDAHREMLRGPARELWLWHALEESEHKAVAFDVYEAVDGSYLRRAGGMIPVTIFFVGATIVVYAAMLAERGLLRDVKGILRTIDYLWIRRGLFRSLIPAYLAYFRPGFHPNDHDTRALVAKWNDALFGNSGAMREKLTKRTVLRAA